ncbi:MAG: FtsW/RodA/SpoVE family cell cycle protein [Anaerostipes sp.]|nr:FtsW/RodA/SpoVE family cell cycle protein [Anaerostipes sp.]MDD3745197.1 FtsW/RodA/SpoVE family cell cycle protein [Anaerostipes sp.]
MKNPVKEKYMKKDFFDYSFLFLVLFLVGFGLVMIFSTSSYKSMLTYGNPYHWLVRQGMIAVAAGIVMLVIGIKFDYRVLNQKAFAQIADYGTLIFLVSVLILGSAKNGSVRWISIAGIQIQPSEFAKIGLVVFLAYTLSHNVKRMKDWKYYIGYVLCFRCGPIILLVAFQNLSTALVLAAISGVMIFVVSPKSKVLLSCAGAGVAAIVMYLAFNSGYRNERIAIWMHPETHQKGLQTMQALYAIGSGGIFGKGLGQSLQKMGFVPESHNDMIFSIICEELGLVGAFCLILLFLALIWRMLLIAMNAKDLFGSLLVVGFMTHIGVQVFINMAVVTNTIPPTGIPLPFISYGGSSIFVVLLEMGLTLAVSRKIRM